MSEVQANEATASVCFLSWGVNNRKCVNIQIDKQPQSLRLRQNNHFFPSRRWEPAHIFLFEHCVIVCKEGKNKLVYLPSPSFVMIVFYLAHCID